ncbi:response regulator transcription factor [Chitinophagaceae bacterium MMS25-I14]
MRQKTKLLLLEDDAFLGQVLVEILQKNNFDVTLSANGDEAWMQYHALQPHICVLDIIVPGRDGFELAKDIRLTDPHIPIIFLTAKTTTEDLVKGFEVGANDYIRKPFSIEELLVRIQARLNIPADNFSTKQFGDASFNKISQVLHVQNEAFELTGKEAALLNLLVSNKNNLLSKEAILLSVWGSDSFMNSRTLDVFISKLRKYFYNSDSVKIMNIRGIGYRLLVSEG